MIKELCEASTCVFCTAGQCCKICESRVNKTDFVFEKGIFTDSVFPLKTAVLREPTAFS